MSIISKAFETSSNVYNSCLNSDSFCEYLNGKASDAAQNLAAIMQIEVDAAGDIITETIPSGMDINALISGYVRNDDGELVFCGYKISDVVLALNDTANESIDAVTYSANGVQTRISTSIDDFMAYNMNSIEQIKAQAEVYKASFDKIKIGDLTPLDPATINASLKAKGIDIEAIRDSNIGAAIQGGFDPRQLSSLLADSKLAIRKFIDAQESEEFISPVFSINEQSNANIIGAAFGSIWSDIQQLANSVGSAINVGWDFINTAISYVFAIVGKFIGKIDLRGLTTDFESKNYGDAVLDVPLLQLDLSRQQMHDALDGADAFDAYGGLVSIDFNNGNTEMINHVMNIEVNYPYTFTADGMVISMYLDDSDIYHVYGFPCFTPFRENSIIPNINISYEENNDAFLCTLEQAYSFSSDSYKAAYEDCLADPSSTKVGHLLYMWYQYYKNANTNNALMFPELFNIISSLCEARIAPYIESPFWRAALGIDTANNVLNCADSNPFMYDRSVTGNSLAKWVKWAKYQCDVRTDEFLSNIGLTLGKAFALSHLSRYECNFSIIGTFSLFTVNIDADTGFATLVQNGEFNGAGTIESRWNYLSGETLIVHTDEGPSYNYPDNLSQVISRAFPNSAVPTSQPIWYPVSHSFGHSYAILHLQSFDEQVREVKAVILSIAATIAIAVALTLTFTVGRKVKTKLTIKAQQRFNDLQKAKEAFADTPTEQKLKDYRKARRKYNKYAKYLTGLGLGAASVPLMPNADIAQKFEDSNNLQELLDLIV